MSKKTENNKNINQKKNKVSENKGESQTTAETADTDPQSPPNDAVFFLGVSQEINFDHLEERRKSLSEEHEKLLASNRALQEEVLRLKSKIDKCADLLATMEDLKRKMKELVPEDRHTQVDRVFADWMASLKVHMIPNSDSGEEHDRKEVSSEVPLRMQIEDLKKQIGSFKQKMRTYKESGRVTTESALANVKEEIGRVREGISKLRGKFSDLEKRDVVSENAELIRKLDEVKEFLEKLQ